MYYYFICQNSLCTHCQHVYIFCPYSTECDFVVSFVPGEDEENLSEPFHLELACKDVGCPAQQVKVESTNVSVSPLQAPVPAFALRKIHP